MTRTSTVEPPTANLMTVSCKTSQRPACHKRRRMTKRHETPVLSPPHDLLVASLPHGIWHDLTSWHFSWLSLMISRALHLPTIQISWFNLMNHARKYSWVSLMAMMIDTYPRDWSSWLILMIDPHDTFSWFNFTVLLMTSPWLIHPNESHPHDFAYDSTSWLTSSRPNLMTHILINETQESHPRNLITHTLMI